MRKRLTGAETRLERAVQRECNRHAGDYDEGVSGFLDDLFYGGCASGMVGSLVYYNDTIPFYKRHQEEIDALLGAMLDDCGCSPAQLFGDNWDDSDPLAHRTHNHNLLAWFGFEETARRLADRNGYEG